MSTTLDPGLGPWTALERHDLLARLAGAERELSEAIAHLTVHKARPRVNQDLDESLLQIGKARSLLRSLAARVRAVQPGRP